MLVDLVGGRCWVGMRGWRSRTAAARCPTPFREADMSTSDWPSSPLDAAERAFTLLVQPPTHVGFDGRGFAGLPDEILPLDELRDLLLSPAASVKVRDAVWRELVTRARRDGPAWVVAAVGVAMPGLRRGATRVGAGGGGGNADP